MKKKTIIFCHCQHAKKEGDIFVRRNATLSAIYPCSSSAAELLSLRP